MILRLLRGANTRDVKKKKKPVKPLQLPVLVTTLRPALLARRITAASSELGEHKRIAVKIVDHRGIEGLKVLEVE